LDNDDNHTFEAIEYVVLISVFNLPVTGNEVHQEGGSYKSDLAKKIVHSVNRNINDYDAIESVNELLTKN
jgi:hypothetical protein